MYQFYDDEMGKIGEIKLEIMPDNITYDEETDSFMVAGHTRFLENIFNIIQVKGICGKYIFIFGNGFGGFWLIGFYL